jgi:hypothetical protein
MNAVRIGFGGAFVMTRAGCQRPAKPYLLERSQQKQTLNNSDSIPLPPCNHPPHPSPRLFAIPLPRWNQMPMRMTHRLPRRLA